MLTLLLLVSLPTADYDVRSDGVDDDARSGQGDEAFRTLAYACDRAAAGDTIRLGPGRHLCTRPAVIKPKMRVLGRGFHGRGENFSVLVADLPNWERPLVDEASGRFCEGAYEDRVLAYVHKADEASFFGVQFQSEPENPQASGGPADRLVGGVFVRDCTGVTIDTCRFEDFRWAGVYGFVCTDLRILRCGFSRCSTDKCGHRGGQIYTRWQTNIEVANCRLAPLEASGGYGYKGGGHTGAKIHDNTVTPCYFAIESPHENEAGVEINNNVLHGAISIPKGGDAAPPQKRGFPFSFDIHHNVITSSYVIEGPRNYLNVHHNYMPLEKPGGCVYTQFGGFTEGPIWIEHNVIENVDRSLVWQREGRTANLFVRANTVFFADAGPRTGLAFSAWAGDRIDNWVVEDNIFVAAWSRPRSLMRTERGVPEKITLRNNVMVNMLGGASGNRAVSPGLVRGEAEKPWAYYRPLSEDSPVVGTATRLNFDGDSRLDVGAVPLDVDLSGGDFGPVGPRP